MISPPVPPTHSTGASLQQRNRSGALPDRRVPAPARYVGSAWADINACLILFAVALGLYAYTLAPTITWGDDVTLTIAAVRGELQASAGSHPLWTALAHLLARIPGGDQAYRVNLVSAIAAAGTVAIMYLVFRQLDISRPGSLAGSLALGISHTFWAHAVRAEVYTLTLATLALLLWAALKWRRTGCRRYLALTGLAIGLALSTHVLALLYLPALVWLVVRAKPGKRDLAVLGAAALVSLVPLGLLLWRDNLQLQTGMFGLLRWALLTFEGYDFADRMFRFGVSTLVHDAVMWAAYLGFQFAGVGLLLLAGGAVISWRRWPRDIALFVVALYLVPAVFAFAYNVGDRYVFFLPSYLAASIWLAAGAAALLDNIATHIAGAYRKAGITLALLILICAVPVVSYRYAPDLLHATGIRLGGGRYVPGPNSRYFLLWPPKRGYYDARQFAEAALTHAPQDALLLADPVLASPIQYLIEIEGLRSDVSVRFCCWDMEAVMSEFPGRPIALADITPEIYPIGKLQSQYSIQPHGPLHLLQPRP